MADFLSGIAIASSRRARRSARNVPLGELRTRIADAPPALPFVASDQGFDVIAEVKRRAPGGGPAARHSPSRLAADYAAGGAVAVSVLTEPLAFDGSLLDLAAASATLREADRPIPTMRKDFLVDPYQVFEARVAGAGGVLLIADLDGADPAALLDAVAECGLWILVEAFADDALDRAAAIARDATGRGIHALVGVNVRDLRTLALDPSRLARVAPRLPPGRLAVAESGLAGPEQVAAVAELGYSCALVGRALSVATEPSALLAEMIRAGRTARRRAA